MDVRGLGNKINIGRETKWRGGNKKTMVSVGSFRELLTVWKVASSPWHYHLTLGCWKVESLQHVWLGMGTGIILWEHAATTVQVCRGRQTQGLTDAASCSLDALQWLLWLFYGSLLLLFKNALAVNIYQSFTSSQEKCFILSSKLTEERFDLLFTSKLMELYPACFLYVLCAEKHDLACLLSKLMQ